jgi:hypothetical protein
VIQGDDNMVDPEKENKEDLEGLFDLAIPIGMPVTVIRDLVEKFEVDLVKRPAKVDLIGEVEDREILVLRGDMDTILAAKEYMFDALDRRVEEWDRADRYKHIRPPGSKKSPKPEDSL